MLNKNSKCAHLIASICSETIAVIFHPYFDVVSCSLLTPAQALDILWGGGQHMHHDTVFNILQFVYMWIRTMKLFTLPFDQPIRSSIFWPNLESSLLQALFLGSTDHFCFLRAESQWDCINKVYKCTKQLLHYVKCCLTMWSTN